MNILKKLLHKYRYFRSKEYRAKFSERAERQKFLSMPRYTQGHMGVLGRPLKFVDGASCYFIYQEIFKEEIYKFATSTPNPYIIDAGANIGLSVIYFKNLFPQASIVAFEPDENVFSVLSENVKVFELAGVALEKKALWKEETELQFFNEGADAGRVATTAQDPSATSVQAVRLRSYLEKKVDLLKMDIEGAETTVLVDCKDLLHNVDRLFVEYHSFEGQEQTLAELLAVLKAAGFRLSVSTPGLTSKSPFMKMETYAGMDMQLNIYGFRV